MELVDIVDGDGKIIGQTSKQEAHEKGLLHKTVIAEVINAKGEFLLIKQAPHKQDKGQFVSPMGGHVTSGETDEEALKRESFEELGLTNFKFKLIGKKIFSRPVNDHVENHFFIVYEIYSDIDPVLNEESVEFKRFTKEELKKALNETPEQFGAAFHFLIDNLYSFKSN